MRGIGLELLPDRDSENPHIVRLRIREAPHLLEQLPVRHELAGVTSQDLDNLPLGRREAHVDGSLADALGREIDREVFGLDDGKLFRWCRRSSATRDRAINSSMPKGLLT